MKKNIIKRGLIGIPIGIAIGFIITIIISVAIGNGTFYPATEELVDIMGNELNAVIIQTILCGIMGMGYAMASIIWDIESWSLAKQSGIYFVIASIIMFPVAYILNWMEHSIMGVLFYAGVFIAIFVSAWLIQYLAWKNKIKKINREVQKKNNITL